MITTLTKKTLTYTSCYCEENIYMLCKELKRIAPNELENCTVVFISNSNRSIPMWMQASSVNGSPVIWDYHVILMYHDYAASSSCIYDFDTRLPFPCDTARYIKASFRPELQLKDEFIRYFRMVPAATYLAYFASDRSHMLTTSGVYIKPPPTYIPIATKENIMTLPQFINMEHYKNSEQYGTVISEFQFFSLIS
ncbi:N-terminal glutamine amidase-domain-containing protein [Radiomyces spectabilis]|uniref:N-terminal glutamine amidase-domain-containing protein n=1 Tax=Radiomyces spectabilis TaxID=64574 RepID=UPI00222066F2|nr:N-terminal glutamine amidase-domain-containing protein [Radiomyces spectabilis]KAI8364805.1 N-terminal glutamine amidase-domain-containing protein [Radiomyces spectabilis]